MKAKFHGPCKVKVVCKCGHELEVEEIQSKGAYKTLYMTPCEKCIEEAFIEGNYCGQHC